MISIDQTNAILELVNFDLIILKNKTKDERELSKEDFLNSFNENIMQIRLLCPNNTFDEIINSCLLYTSPSPRDRQKCRMPSSA